MQTSRLTRTLERASCRDPAVRLVETTAGSSCGVIPTAIARENSSAASTGLCSATLMMKIAVVSTAATWTSSIENLRSPAWNSVSGCPCPRPTAIRPNSAWLPVATTTPVADPARTTVPISAQQLSSASGEPAATGSVDFSTGSDSPVRTDSSHSSPAVVSSRISAGTTWPSCRSTTSPGTSSVTSTVCGCPSRHVTQL